MSLLRGPSGPSAPDPWSTSLSLDDNTQRRINIFLIVIFAAMAIIGIRLWTMQVIMGEKYEAKSQGNRLREVNLPSTRGLVYDRNGTILVDNRASIVVSVAHDAQTTSANVQKWSKLLKKKPDQILQAIEYSKGQNPLARRLLALDVNLDTVAVLREHEDDYPELKVSLESIRTYPHRTVGSHILGYIGEISDKQLPLERYKGYTAGDLVGKAGVEQSYELLMSGVKGTEQLEVDATGMPVRRVNTIPAAPGHSVKLTLDRRIQGAAEQALVFGAKIARRGGYPDAKAGAAVVLDATNGDILALASYPTYDPSSFIGGISTKEWKAMNDKKNNFPLYNRAVMSVYPPGSTLKPFVAIGAMLNGYASQGSTFVCKGKWKGSQKWNRAFKDWTPAGHGAIGLKRGLAESCDIVFYELGYRFHKGGEDKMQKSLRRFGFGKPTGVDLPFEAKGRVPDPAWKKRFNKNSPEYARWLPGDSVSMAIGQGDFLASPLQIASAYGALANGGTLYRPHLVKSILAADGRTIRKIKPEPVSQIEEIRRYTVIGAGLKQVVNDGTASDAFKGFPVEVAGKTGTSQVQGKDDFALFASYAPADDPKYVVVVLIEQGGHGGSVAAPAARKIYAEIFNIEDEIAAVPAKDSSR